MRTKIIIMATMSLLFAQSAYGVRAEGVRASCPGCRQLKNNAIKIIPAHLNYVPFEWVTFRAVTTSELVDGIHKAIRFDLDKAQSEDTHKSVVRLLSPTDIGTLKTLLQNRHNLPDTTFLGEPRLLFEADNGETEVFVYAGGTASQGTHKWKLSTQDFKQLKQMLHRIYSGPGSYYSKPTS